MKFKTLFLSLILAISLLLSFNSYTLSVLEDGCDPDYDIFCEDDRPKWKFSVSIPKKGYEIIKPLAEQGDANAQFRLGELYKYGRGVEQDYKKAVYWHTKGAEQNEHNSQSSLALMYYNGQGVEEDEGQAIYWALRGYYSGSSKNITVYDLAKDMRELGKDYESAFTKLLKLAEEGLIDKRIAAQFNLGLRYEIGLGILRDEKEAIKWYRKVLDEERLYSPSPSPINLKWYKNAQANLKWLTSNLKWFEYAQEDLDWLMPRRFAILWKESESESKPEAEGGKKGKVSKAPITNRWGISKGPITNGKPKNKPKRKPKSKPEERHSSSGTGFVVTKDGVIATAEHVVNGCNKIEVDNLEASIVIADDKNDIALIKVNKTYQDIASIKVRSPKLGDDVMVFGYPLSALLSSEHVSLTKGSVSSLSGMRDDTTRFRYTAASQPGNSGGPIVDDKGMVVGIVSAGLKNDKSLDVNWQNVNFGVRSSLLVNLMDSKNVPITTQERSKEESKEHYEKVTKYIKCFK